MLTIVQKYFSISILFLIVILNSCNKQNEWLEEKRLKNEVILKSLQDFQALLDNTDVMNNNYPTIGLIATDNLYIANASLSGISATERNSYIFAKDVYAGSTPSDYSYQKISYANIVLEGLQNIEIDPSIETNYNNIKGQALFFRALSYYASAQLFCKPFVTATATSDLGIVLRQSSDPNIVYQRATIQATYDQIISDLSTSIELLPVQQLYTTRPSQTSAKALLSKVYLSMGDYSKSFVYANEVLNTYNTLLDYNSNLVSTTSTFRFPAFTTNASTANPEIIFYAAGIGYDASIFAFGVQFVDSLLYQSYENNDRRKLVLYKNNGGVQVKYAGSYTGTFFNFWGIATNEMYLIRAECYARQGNASLAMNDLNSLLKKRYNTGTFTDLTAANSNDALSKVLKERRKELPFTGQIRWEDLRRLNQDSQFSVTINHIYNNVTYSLSPNDKKYVFPIPDREIQLSGVEQNDR
ncbi:RagB/SusD family nutrient uptake outer membrane protein [Niastella caeni]|uniref:RagB/SusD family nutrient uptake outer membrane protein n=1 Tax=Niastella caeni TaxID=2569763 RepID=A0A4S8I2F0_9BACT|nr:RagB/SusD family nutrient uptake outer membrane protein [Niastella caeni]THU40814.1 RagB/SusD family nutrient uptake outer membrane protein [Niastella caeni]